MRKLTLLTLMIALLAACSDGNPTPAPAVPDGEPRPTPTTAVSPQLDPTIPPTAYPPAAPIPTTPPDNYPPPVQPALPENPYPSGVFTWLLLPVGTQCEEGKSYESLTAATNDLTNAGVAVKSSEVVELSVCASCGCPTSEHYRVEIDVEGLDTAVELGWQEE